MNKNFTSPPPVLSTQGQLEDRRGKRVLIDNQIWTIIGYSHGRITPGENLHYWFVQLGDRISQFKLDSKNRKKILGDSVVITEHADKRLKERTILDRSRFRGYIEKTKGIIDRNNPDIKLKFFYSHEDRARIKAVLTGDEKIVLTVINLDFGDLRF